VIPKEGTEKYLSLMGLLDRRSTLFIDPSPLAQADNTKAYTEVFPAKAHCTADVCIMAAKLVYENPAVVEKAVINDWKMHFVKFYNCWNGKLIVLTHTSFLVGASLLCQHRRNPKCPSMEFLKNFMIKCAVMIE